MLTVGVRGALNDPWLSVSYPWYPWNSSRLEDGVGYLQIDRIVDEETLLKFRPLLRGNIWDDAAQTASLVLDLSRSFGLDFYVTKPVAGYASPITGKSWEAEFQSCCGYNREVLHFCCQALLQHLQSADLSSVCVCLKKI